MPERINGLRFFRIFRWDIETGSYSLHFTFIMIPELN
jgi:hypothetical protein